MILMIYNEKFSEEVVLPNIHDADYEVNLYREKHGLRTDLQLKLERSAVGWEMITSKAYRLRLENKDCERVRLGENKVVRVTTSYNETLFLIPSEEEGCLRIMEKYDLSRSARVRIGSDEKCEISYSFQKYVSGFHAELFRNREGWYIRDTSSNGIFKEKKRLKNVHLMQNGDAFFIFGLHIIYINQILLVGSNCGRLSVNETRLPKLPLEQPKKEDGGRQYSHDVNFYNRSPRNLPHLYTEPVEIDAPPTPKNQKQKPTYLVIGPAFSMAIPMTCGCLLAVFASQMSGSGSNAFMYTGLVTAVGAALIGAVWAMLNLNYSKKESVEDEEQRFNAYSNYLLKIVQQLQKQYQHNSLAMNQIYPSAAEILRYNRKTPELWNRNSSHEDFLFVRTGLGDQPFQVDINIQKDKFTLVNDSLLEQPKTIQQKYKTLHNVPVGVSLLQERLIGLVGGAEKDGAYQLMHNLVAHIAGEHCYTDVKMVFVYDENDRRHLGDWECMRWLPHVWSEDKSTRYMAGNELERRDIFFELSNILRRRQEAAGEERTRKARLQKPYYVLFASDAKLLEGELLSKYIYDQNPENGLTAFLLTERLDQLPNACELVIQNDQKFKGIFRLMDMNREHQQLFVPDTVSANALTEFGKRLANIYVKEVEINSEIPESMSFFEMYGVHSMEEFHVSDRWRRNRTYESMKALIGKKAGNTDCYLDIHEKFHGPHGLLAGTTGSGKSETLQTYILSMALNFSPEDVSFFIIDFKGGGMANLFNGLPHLAGQISNLSGNQVSRAMISIKSENVRRQRIFARYNVNNINLYTRLYKNHEANIPVPHLFIVIDEFAELKREEPEFMQELISVAQVGRSLGVHLILATQKPSGTVDDNIWSNSKFRLCLRVQDRQDSMDMLHKPDAAFLTQAGRCYLQVGSDEIYELFQSGYSGAIYREDAGRTSAAVSMITRSGKVAMVGVNTAVSSQVADGKSGMKEVTQLDAVIDYLHKLAALTGYQQSPQLWLPVLEKEIYLDSIRPDDMVYTADQGWPSANEQSHHLYAYVGLYDDPENQKQEPLVIDFAECGHLAVMGSVVSGKSTFLQTMVYSLISSYSPDRVQLYLIDYSSHMLQPFAEAPHVGGIVTEQEEDKRKKLFHMLSVMMVERQKELAGGSYQQYIQMKGNKMPAIIIVLDNYASFKDKTTDMHLDFLLRLAREGVGCGMFLVISSVGFGGGDVPSRLGDHFRTTISLEQTDKYKYIEVLRKTHLQIMPEANVKGRGLAVVGESVLEYQTALAVKSPTDFDRIRLLEADARQMQAAWKGQKALPIPEIPAEPKISDLQENAQYQLAIRSRDRLPIGYRMQDASIYSISLAKSYCMLVAGKRRTGKTNVLRLFLYATGAKDAQVCLIEKPKSDFGEMASLAEQMKAEYITDAKGLYQYFQNLLPEFARRNKKKQELLRQNIEEEDLFDIMKEEQPIFILIADMMDFLNMVYRPEPGVGTMSGFLENIIDKGSLHNIYFIAGLNIDDAPLLGAYKAYQRFASYSRGVYLGGNLQQQKIFRFQNLSFVQQQKTQKKGFGYITDDEEEDSGVEIVLPLAK